MRPTGSNSHRSANALALAGVLGACLLMPSSAHAAATLTHEFDPATKAVTLRWSLPSGEVSLSVALFYSTSGGTCDGFSSYVGAADTSYTSGPLDPGREYKAWVNTRDGSYNYFCSNVVTFQVPPDSDRDGILDPVDQCPTEAAPQGDSDGCPYRPTPPADADADGVADSADNCASLANADQANRDGDAQGDACDPDDDNDGVADTADACPTTAAQTSNGCPSSGAGQPPPAADADRDGKPDSSDPDDDNDGVYDEDDLCPRSTGYPVFTASGCPFGTTRVLLGSATVVREGTSERVRGMTVIDLPDRVKTSDGSIIEISPVPKGWGAPGSAIRLASKSNLLWEKLVAILSKGKARFEMKKGRGARVQAGNAKIEAPKKGAAFAIEKKGQTTVVRGQKGTVKVSNDKGNEKTVTLKPGMQTVVPAKGPPASPTKYKLKPCAPTAQLKPFHWQCPEKLPATA